ncbi:heme NO-binding domain-containing protein [Litoreibacter roseus]|uniref:Heme NO-binding domain-containing protein n=1 Tax=Litoreibacter roseus TaxID=2601869 RepID=A0A6N6JHL1_9RHOB|nr:heme NO-binding domain-containing protein [Litoreibacter roseus]GFE65427.1 hypothetical protein KIN_25010 [Litoreibacter roseus]
MYGLINRSIQCFLEDTYGAELWDQVVHDAQLDFRDFEGMLTYEDHVTDTVLKSACEFLDRDQSSLLEDIGTYLVTHPNMERVRRLMRFGGHSFEEFLFSLDDLHDRVRLAIPDLELPRLDLRDFAGQSYGLVCTWRKPGFGAVLQGVLRAMADDYGALVLLDLEAGDDGQEMVRIDLLETDFASGRTFSLAPAEQDDLSSVRNRRQGDEGSTHLAAAGELGQMS